MEFTLKLWEAYPTSQDTCINIPIGCNPQIDDEFCEKLQAQINVYNRAYHNLKDRCYVETMDSYILLKIPPELHLNLNLELFQNQNNILNYVAKGICELEDYRLSEKQKHLDMLAEASKNLIKRVNQVKNMGNMGKCEIKPKIIEEPKEIVKKENKRPVVDLEEWK